MFWLKLCGFFTPLLGYGILLYTTVLSASQGVVAFVGAGGFLFGGLVASIFHELERWFERTSDTFGSAAFAGWYDIWRARLFGKSGVILGRHSGRLIRFNEPGHLLTIAPTRSGKGTCAVVPNLLDYPGSVVTVDIKGENYAIAGRRRRHFGQVFRLAPFDSFSDRLNPLDLVRDDDNAWDDAAFLADMIVIPSGAAKAVFFEYEARALLTGIILYVAIAMPPERRNLAHVRHLITLGGDALFETLARMTKSRNALVRRTAEAFGQKEERLQSSILAEAQSHTLVFDSDRAARITSCSDFSLDQLKEQAMSLFLIVPPEYLAVYRPLIRLFLGLAVRAMTRSARRSDHDVLFLVDEFPTLGRMKPLEDGLAYLAGYGVKLWLFAQDLGQLESVYGENVTRSIIANTNLQTFSNTDNATLEMISTMLGSQTVRIRNRSQSRRSLILPDYDHFNVSASETGRPLLTPDEIRCLGQEHELLFLKGVRPILARKTPYFREERYRGLWDRWNA